METKGDYMDGLVIKNNWHLLSVDKLKKADWNYKLDNDVMASKLINNIKLHGQLENIIVRELSDDMYEVVNGNHRFDALTSLGVKEVMVYNLGEISESHAKRIAIETNETKFLSDQVKLANVIDNIISEFALENVIETMPFSKEELVNFQNMNNFDWNKYAESTPSVDNSLNQTNNSLTIKLTDREFERWSGWLDSIEHLTTKDTKESFLVLLTVCEKLSVEEIEAIIDKS